MECSLRIFLMGFGVVGQSFARLIEERTTELVRRFGLRPRLVAVADRSGVVMNPRGLETRRLLEVKAEKGSVMGYGEQAAASSGVAEVLEGSDAEVLVEVTPTNIKTGQPGLNHIMTALKNRRHVITANKGPLALALPALLELARFNHVFLRFSGTVGGGTPILNFAKKCLLNDRIIAVRGILNGTTNYILSRMTRERIGFAEALQAAQKAGYAEADPSMDVNGYDTATKLVIMANWVMDLKATLRDVNVTGIRNVTVRDVTDTFEKGQEVKLIASAEDRLIVEPQPVARTDPICVSGVLNAVTFKSQHGGEQTVIGVGAGGKETANAILRDLIEIKQNLFPPQAEW
ncbi:MAG: homoserine dehydrogenase [Candidatus Bathyarchaeia archaeon]